VVRWGSAGCEARFLRVLPGSGVVGCFGEKVQLQGRGILEISSSLEMTQQLFASRIKVGLKLHAALQRAPADVSRRTGGR
jgi:hypothetical protein